MRQVEIARKAGITPRHINDIVRGRKTPSPKLAKKLEQITGISRIAWLYPEEFSNPYIRLPLQHNRKAINEADARS